MGREAVGSIMRQMLQGSKRNHHNENAQETDDDNEFGLDEGDEGDEGEDDEEEDDGDSDGEGEEGISSSKSKRRRREEAVTSLFRSGAYETVMVILQDHVAKVRKLFMRFTSNSAFNKNECVHAALCVLMVLVILQDHVAQ
jgi:hypothetical protein